MVATEKPKIFHAIGRRKSAIASVRLYNGSGRFIVNGKDLEDYCSTEQMVRQIKTPLVTVDQIDKIDVIVMVKGSGSTGQSGAISLGISRALQLMNPELRGILKPKGHLTRDPRAKERKKPGQPGARKKFQFSKR